MQWRFVECRECLEEYFPRFDQLTFFCGITGTVFCLAFLWTVPGSDCSCRNSNLFSVSGYFAPVTPVWMHEWCIFPDSFASFTVCSVASLMVLIMWGLFCHILPVSYAVKMCIYGDFVFFCWCCCWAKELCFYCSKPFTKVVHFRVWFVCKLHRHINLDKKIESCENVRLITLTRLICMCS